MRSVKVKSVKFEIAFDDGTPDGAVAGMEITDPSAVGRLIVESGRLGDFLYFVLKKATGEELDMHVELEATKEN